MRLGPLGVNTRHAGVRSEEVFHELRERITPAVRRMVANPGDENLVALDDDVVKPVEPGLEPGATKCLHARRSGFIRAHRVRRHWSEPRAGANGEPLQAQRP